jgi:hypothetical protein
MRREYDSLPPVTVGTATAMQHAPGTFGDAYLDQRGHHPRTDAAGQNRLLRAPAGVEPLHWRLLTTHRVDDLTQAWQIVAWYQARWSIEPLFRVARSQGLGLEDSRLETADRLARLAAAAMKAACVDMQLVQERDGVHGLPATTVFSAVQIVTLAALSPTLEGATERQRNHHPPGSLAWAAWAIARLGGWNCYGSPPGPITFHRGMERFNAIHEG